MRIGIVFEIEDALFDMHAVRVDALQAAMSAEGLPMARDAVSNAHRGVPASLALHGLAARIPLDDTARELILLRTHDELRMRLDVQLPSFHVGTRDAILALAADVPVAVVTRATRELAQQLLAACGLDAAVSTVRSVADLPACGPVEQWTGPWAAAAGALRADECVAIAPLPMLEFARRAGLHTVAVVTDSTEPDASAHRPDATIVSFAQLNAAFLAALP